MNDEIKELLDKWEDGNYINPDALESAHRAISLLVDRINELEEKVNSLL
jgi:hypothetical protein